MHTHMDTFHSFSGTAVTNLVMAAESLIQLFAHTFFCQTDTVERQAHTLSCIV